MKKSLIVSFLKPVLLMACVLIPLKFSCDMMESSIQEKKASEKVRIGKKIDQLENSDDTFGKSLYSSLRDDLHFAETDGEIEKVEKSVDWYVSLEHQMKTPKKFSSSDHVTESKLESSLEYKLATIDNGFVEANNPVVNRIKGLLGQLGSKYLEDKQEISDMTVKSHNLMNEAGIQESCENIMEDMNLALPHQILAEDGKNNQSYAEYIALYVNQRRSGSSRESVVNAIRALTTL